VPFELDACLLIGIRAVNNPEKPAGASFVSVDSAGKQFRIGGRGIRRRARPG
jgi:hypothetical protein